MSFVLITPPNSISRTPRSIVRMELDLDADIPPLSLDDPRLEPDTPQRTPLPVEKPQLLITNLPDDIINEILVQVGATGDWSRVVNLLSSNKRFNAVYKSMARRNVKLAFFEACFSFKRSLYEAYVNIDWCTTYRCTIPEEVVALQSKVYATLESKRVSFCDYELMYKAFLDLGNFREWRSKIRMRFNQAAGENRRDRIVRAMVITWFERRIESLGIQVDSLHDGWAFLAEIADNVDTLFQNANASSASLLLPPQLFSMDNYFYSMTYGEHAEDSSTSEDEDTEGSAGFFDNSDSE